MIGGEVAAVDQAMTLQRSWCEANDSVKCEWPFPYGAVTTSIKKLAQDLAKLNFQTMQIPVISNTTAEIMPQEAIQALLEKQVMSAVRFEDSIETMKAMNVGTMIEVGPGKTLTGFVKKIDKTIEMHRVEDVATLTETLTALTGR